MQDTPFQRIGRDYGFGFNRAKGITCIHIFTRLARFVTSTRTLSFDVSDATNLDFLLILLMMRVGLILISILQLLGTMHRHAR